MKRIILLLLLAFVFMLPYTVKAQSITVENFSLVHDYMRNGVKGLLMKSTFIVNGMRNQNIKAVFAIVLNNTLVTASDGRLMRLAFDLVPAYDSAKWTDYEAFIPYSLFPPVAGTMEYDAVFGVLDPSDTPHLILKEDGTDYSLVHFTHTRTGPVINVPSTIPMIPSTPSGPVQAPICRKCHGVGHYYINGVFYTCTQCGGLGRDWNS